MKPKYTLSGLIVATAVAGMVGLKVVHGFVYPRTEGGKLEAQVAKIEKSVNDRIERVEKRVDKKFNTIISILQKNKPKHEQ